MLTSDLSMIWRVRRQMQVCFLMYATFFLLCNKMSLTLDENNIGNEFDFVFVAYNAQLHLCWDFCSSFTIWSTDRKPLKYLQQMEILPYLGICPVMSKLFKKKIIILINSSRSLAVNFIFLAVRVGGGQPRFVSNSQGELWWRNALSRVAAGVSEWVAI